MIVFFPFPVYVYHLYIKYNKVLVSFGRRCIMSSDMIDFFCICVLH